MNIKTTTINGARRAPPIRAASKIPHSAGYLAAREGVTVSVPGGLRIELYRRRDGGTECSWMPQRPDFKRREVRAYVLTYYDSLVEEFEERCGPAGEIRNAAYGKQKP